MAITRLRFAKDTSARIIGTITDRDGDVVTPDVLTDATLSLFDQQTKVIINERDTQDVLGAGSPYVSNGVTLFATLQADDDGTTYNYEWLLDAEDNAIVTPRRQVERHLAEFLFTWADGQLRAVFEIDVENVT